MLLGVIFLALLALSVLLGGLWLSIRYKKDNPGNYKPNFTFYITGTIIISLLIGSFSYFLSTSEGFKRDVRAFQAEYNEGIERQIIVYSEGGEVIYEETGRFSVQHSDDQINWVDENGQSQYIYLGRSATAVVNEIGEDRERVEE